MTEMTLQTTAQTTTQSVLPQAWASRTWLFVPANTMERVPKAFASAADAVIIDLEDAVAESEKALGRQALKTYHDSEDYRPVWVRVNPATGPQFAIDLAAVKQLPKLAGILLPKAEQPEDIERIHLATGVPVIALIETAKGLYQLDKMATATGLLGFSYGFLDLCNDLGVQVGTASADIFADQVRYQLLICSKVHGLMPPIDSIYPDFSDEVGLTAYVQHWADMGLSGMLCIHPKQVPRVYETLLPSSEQLAFAKAVVAAYQSSQKAAFAIAGQMVDMPVIVRSQQLLSRYGQQTT